MRRSIGTVLLIGALIGVLNLVHYNLTDRIDGIETPFGIFPGGFPVATMIGLTRRELSHDLIVMIVLGLGILTGSTISARQSGDFSFAKIRATKLPPRKAKRAVIGGVLMGAGTWMAQGCLIKHTLSGSPALMLSSMVTLVGICLGIWLSAKAAE